MAGIIDAPFMRSAAVPLVCILIAFLGYFSQYVFLKSTTLEPGPPSRTETIVFNALLSCLWITYFRAVSVDPGRLVSNDDALVLERKWCKKCAAPKPPRAHHCRVCGRCIPKMDHHCPWTRNCVSMTTFPHFVRFLIYTNLSLFTLAYFLWQRFWHLWISRHLPAYLGPSLPALVSLAILSMVNFLTTLALTIMLVNTLSSWLFNRTTIEDWEISRHEELLTRNGNVGWWQGASEDEDDDHLERVEFPYDVGIFRNMAQTMGTRNFLLWLWPLAGNPKVGCNSQGNGWSWEENGFNSKEGLWPPYDPDKARREGRAWVPGSAAYQDELRRAESNLNGGKEAFIRRQQEDFRRRGMIMAELEEVDGEPLVCADNAFDWTNDDGERLEDYGVDGDAEEVIDLTNDDEVPLAELLRRRTTATRSPDDE